MTVFPSEWSDPARYDNGLVLEAALGRTTVRTPIWMMRQAGRTDPEYNRIRQQCGLALEALFAHPGLAAEISLLPRRFGVDAIIFFQDILTPLGPMGAPFVFSPGPTLTQPVRTAADIERLHAFDVADELPFVGETFGRVHAELAGAMPVLGFAGAPLTLATFLLEGGSFGHDAPALKKLMETSPGTLHGLLEMLSEMTIDYLNYQIQCGAAAVQLFESAAHLLSASDYESFALPYQKWVLEAVDTAPRIMFARERPELNLLAQTGADVISLPSSVSISAAREHFGPQQALQGNLDNRLLCDGPLDDALMQAEACVREGGHHAHIFNLSHGLLRETPFEHVTSLVDCVKRVRVGR